MLKPEPVHKGATCSVCGLDWDRHGKAPTIEKCVELLKAELAPRQWQRPWTYPQYPQTYPAAGTNPRWYGNTWGTGTPGSTTC